ncbi:hypothetical protein BDN67DRAFT_1013826 [Paxillus ammoniavirescens]|nr:hypothetical protein BDN67DRAFT_1013826 [Paxillus ammoniavirescens]
MPTIRIHVLALCIHMILVDDSHASPLAPHVTDWGQSESKYAPDVGNQRSLHMYLYTTAHTGLQLAHGPSPARSLSHPPYHSYPTPATRRLMLFTTTRPILNCFTSLPGFDLKVPSRITYPSFPSFFTSSWLITENLSCSAREKEEICLSASVLTASIKGQTIRALPPSTGLVLVSS